MPTGYTADVQDGKTTDLRTFTLQCARAFGALVSMRDSAHDAPIPEELVPSKYNNERLAEARKRHTELQAMSSEDVTAACEKANREAIKQSRESQERTATARARYESMLKKVRAWTPPTADHEGLKDFMVKQLQESIGFDCHESGPPEPQKRDVWLEAQQDRAMLDIGYHSKAAAEEKARVARRNHWIRALRESLEGE